MRRSCAHKEIAHGPSPFRRPTNLSLDARLVEEARELGINLSRASEDALAREVKAERERRFKEENREAFEEYNRFIAEHGLPLERYRLF
jgi:antitoxin CcdA